MIDGKIITQACKIVDKTHDEIKKMVGDLKEIFQTTQPPMEFYKEYSYKPEGLAISKWYLVLFNEVSKLKTGKNSNRFFIMIFIFCNSGDTKQLIYDEPELWCGLVEITNSKNPVGTNPWEIVEILKYDKYFMPTELELGGKKYRYLYDEKDKYGKWEGDFVGYKLTDFSSREKLKALVVDKLF